MVNTETYKTIALCDQNTGEVVEEARVTARQYPTNFKAMINWRSITVIRPGDSADAAIQSAIEEFRSKPPVSQYDVRLT